MSEELDARVALLEARIRELTDREAIRELRFRYHECINSETLEPIPGLFTEDGVLDFDYLGRAEGRSELSIFFNREGSPLTFVRQFVHNHSVEVSGDAGSGYAYLEAKTISAGEAFLVAARYDDEYRRVGGEWKFKRMALTPYFTVPFKEGWAQEDRLKMRR
jgi:hypothetical protein